MDGDDAAELFDELHARFNTALGALGEVWNDHFNDEGMPLGGGLWLLVVGVVGASIANATALWPGWGALFAIAIVVGGRLAWNHWGPQDPHRAITVRDVVRAVEAGAWPRPELWSAMGGKLTSIPSYEAGVPDS